METFLVEEVIMQKEAPKKKYKCPYCDERYERAKLHIHIQNKHEDLIPEGYTALRVAFNTINNKTEGHCIICKGVTDWNEDKGRYERLCNNPACKEAYKKMIAERYNRIYGTDRLQTDPQYAEYVQRKALEGRKMSGKYKFEDGGEVNYMGTYEKKFLMFMDTVMHCKSEDIIAPGPSIKYMWEGKEHLYLPDYYYEPYNLIIEIKDGGSNPNTHSKRLGEEAERIAAKEAGVKKDGHFNYVRVTNNDFGQLLQIMSVLKYQMKHPYYYTEPVFRINESAEESKIPYFSSDVSLLDFMKKNIKYKDFTKLMSAEEVFEQKKGSCHDQVMFELYCLRRLGYKPIATFCIEYKDGESEGGVTHSFVTYKKDNKVCWFENAWEGQEGIHKFESSKAVKDKILELHKEGKFGNNTKYPEVEFSSFGKHEPGETLDDFVNKCLNESMVSEDMSGAINAALPPTALTPTPIPYESDKDNYYIIQHPQNNVFNYSITKDPLQHKLFTVDAENPGFYNVIKTDKGKISKKYLTFKIKDSQKAKELYDELEKIEEHGGKFHDEVYENYIYEKLTEGSKLLDPEQILFDDRFELVKDFDAQLKEDCDNLYRWLMPTPMELLEHHMALLEDWYTDGLQDYNVLPDNIDNLADLNEWKHRFYSMPHDQQRKGDDLSIDLYGDTNFNRYNKKYAKLINQISPDIDEPEVVKDTLGYITGLAEVASETEVLVSYDEWDLKMEKCRQAERDGLLIMIDTDGEKVEEYTADAIAKLKQKYAALQNMNPDKRVLSNQTASNILGLDNENLYSRILTAYLNRIDNINPKNFEDVTNREDEVVTAVQAPVPTPYYTPDNAEFVSSEKHPEDQYTAAESAQLRDLTMLLKFTSKPEKRKALKEQIFEMGWNPEIPYNVEKAKYTYLRYKDFVNIEEVDVTNLSEADEAISQAKYTSEQLKDKIVPVFVILTHNVLLRSKAIMWFTDSDYSHVSIAFDSSLDEMYTYTIGINNAPNKKHKTGFAVDTIAKYKKFDPHMKTKIYALFVTPEQKAMMQDAVQWYIDNQDNTAYGFGTILNIVLRRPTKPKDGDKCKMVCSQFVYTILKLVEFKMKKTKDSSLVSPGDIDELSDDARFYVVFQDAIDKYDKKKIDKICYKILPTLPLEMYGINEATGVELYRPKSAIRKLDETNRVFKMAEEMLN